MGESEPQRCLRIVASREAVATHIRGRAAELFTQLSDIQASGNTYRFMIADAAAVDVGARTVAQAGFFVWLLLERGVYCEQCYLNVPPVAAGDATAPS